MARRKGLLARFEVVPGQHRPHPVRNGVILLVIVAYALASGYGRHLLFFPRGGTIVHASFASAQNLVKGTEVRVHGVNVGRVAGLHQAADGRSVIVDLRINDIKKLNLRNDATATDYWRTLLGFNMYIEVNPGSPSAPPLDSHFIDTSHTATQVEFDQLLAPLQSQQRKGIQTFFKSFQQGFSGPAPGQVAQQLGPAMRHLGPGLGALRGQNPGDLTRFVQQTNRAVATVQHSEKNLTGLIDSGAVALGVTAARKAELGSAVDQAPATEAQTQATMVRLRTTLSKLDPLAVSLRPGVRQISPAVAAADPALRQAVPLLRTARPLFRDLNPAFTSLQQASQVGVPLLNGFQPTVDRARDTLLPMLNTRDENIKRPLYQLIGPTASSLGSISGDYDAYGHQVRFQVGASAQPLGTSVCQLDLFNVGVGGGRLAQCTALVDALNKIFGTSGAASTNGAHPVATLKNGLPAGGHTPASSSAPSASGVAGAGPDKQVNASLTQGLDNGGQLVATLLTAANGLTK